MMRDSGQNWLGTIPSTWGLSRIGSLYSLRNEKVSDKDYPPLSVTMKGVVPQLESAAKSDDGDNRKLVKIGDFAINSRSDRRGSCGISAYNGSVSLINTVLTPRGEMNPGYYNWLFHTVAFADEFYKWGHGIVDDLWTTRWQEMKRIVVPVPSSAEQQAIAAYLDDQVTQIDSIIAEAQASIEEYKQWKTSVIFEIVTKGLDATTAMRRSSNPGIGMIPAHWKEAKVKQVAQINPSCPVGNLTLNDEVSFAPMECIRTRGIISTWKRGLSFRNSWQQRYRLRIPISRIWMMLLTHFQCLILRMRHCIFMMNRLLIRRGKTSCSLICLS